MDDPMSIGRDVKVPLREITVRTSRSSGPGGQHANVTASRVEAIFDVEASESLTEEQKSGDTGKELVKQINQLLDAKMIPELARIIATATDPAFKDTMNGAIEDFNKFWKFRVDDPSKATAFLKSFEADPSIEGPPVPAKADDGTGAGAPNVTGGPAKLSVGAAAVPGTGAGKGANGTKASGKPSTKGKTTTQGSRKKKR